MMRCQYNIYLSLIVLLTIFLCGCLDASSILTGANLFYDRHHVYKKWNDHQLASQTNQLLFHEGRFHGKNIVLDIAVLNGEILIAGHVPTRALKEKLLKQIEQIQGAKRIFKQIAIMDRPHSAFEDIWITTKIRSQIMKDASINPIGFKIITVDQIVYIMGEVVPLQGRQVLAIARNTKNVLRVVTLLHYQQELQA